MRISDWRSDVCSSDLLGLRAGGWPRPDGMPLTNTPWATNLRALAAASIHRTVAKQWWPSPDHPVRYPSAGSWVRSDERRVGKECVRTCRSRWSPCPDTKTHMTHVQLIPMYRTQ